MLYPLLDIESSCFELLMGEWPAYLLQFDHLALLGLTGAIEVGDRRALDRYCRKTQRQHLTG